MYCTVMCAVCVCTQTNLKGWPESPPYFEGRWSNGPVWAEIAASQLGMDLVNFAVGGAASGGGRPLYHRERVTHNDGTGGRTLWDSLLDIFKTVKHSFGAHPRKTE
jgi:hypothetical protein